MRSEATLSRRALLAETAATLAAAGVIEPRREAIRLWTELVHIPQADLIVDGDREAAPAEAAMLRQAAGRRAAGEPVAHVIGRIGFRALTLRSDRRALIPRPETEGLVDLLLARIRTGRVADLGTGTGCLALSLATEGDFTQVVATDCSADALALADENRASVGAAVRLIQGNLCAAIASASLDAVVSNPPYLTDAEYAGLDPAVKDWEPGVALASGRDGMSATRSLLRETQRVLRPGGWLVMEVDCTRAAKAAAEAGALGWMDVAIHADLFGRERYLLARRSAQS